MTTLIVGEGLLREMSSKNAFNISLFEPLFDMQKLQKVDLSNMYWTLKTFGNEELAKFASAWLTFQELTLSFFRMNATIRALQSFATNCPGLRHLEIPFDGRAVEDSTLPMTSSALEILVVGDTPIPEDELYLARNLDGLFPSLREVSDIFVDTHEWLKVGKLYFRLYAQRSELAVKTVYESLLHFYHDNDLSPILPLCFRRIKNSDMFRVQNLYCFCYETGFSKSERRSDYGIYLQHSNQNS